MTSLLNGSSSACIRYHPFFKQRISPFFLCLAERKLNNLHLLHSSIEMSCTYSSVNFYSSKTTNGSDDDQLAQLAEHFMKALIQRRESYPNQRWNEQKIMQLRSKGVEIPLLLLIISQYHKFTERFKAMEILKKLVLTIAEARTLGAYVIITTEEFSYRQMPSNFVGKMGTKIALFMDELQKYEFIGRTSLKTDPIPGRGIEQTRGDRNMYEIQLALPVTGSTESLRHERFVREIQWLSEQL